MPATAEAGTRGLPVPDPVVMAALPRRGNTALAAPAGFEPAPDIVTAEYNVPAAALYAALLRMAEAQPRTFLAAGFPTRMQAHFVARSARLNFPDVVVVEAVDRGAGLSAAVLYSASVYGRSDFGVNRARLRVWLAALDAEIRG